MGHVDTPLLFKASVAQRAMAFLIFAGSWLSGVRALALILQRLPGVHYALNAARAQGGPTALLWTFFILYLAGVLLGGALLMASLIFLVLVEGTQIALDPVGISVEITTLPGPLARRLGAGRLAWKRIRKVERKGLFFQVRGGAQPAGPGEPQDRDLRFLLVHELERLVLSILERSPNIRLED